MRTRTALTALVGAALAVSTLAAAPVEGEVGDTTEDGFLIVGTDPAGDWGSNVADGAEGVGDASGQDLVSAEIGMDAEADEPTVLFRIRVNSLPATGGVPEFTRYTWNFVVDGNEAELDGKYTNYSRGACDPTSGQCPPPRDPGMQPFILRGNCTMTENVTTCEEIATVQAVFEPADGTITIPVAVSLFDGAGPCSVIEAGANFIAGSISAAHSAFLTYGGQPADTSFVDADFQLPSADGSACPEVD